MGRGHRPIQTVRHWPWPGSFFPPNNEGTRFILLSRAGVDIGDRHGNGADFLPVPAAFILERDGRVAWRFIDVDFTRRAAPERILAALRRLGDMQRG